MTGLSALGLNMSESVPAMDPSTMSKKEKKSSGSILGKSNTVFGTKLTPNLDMSSTILGKMGR